MNSTAVAVATSFVNHSAWVTQGYNRVKTMMYVTDVYIFPILFAVGFAGTHYFVS
jgi:hypothetical protein